MPAAPALAVSIGCPAGVGAEVAVSAAAKLGGAVRVVLVGDRGVIRDAARIRKVAARRLVEVMDCRGIAAIDEHEIGVWAHSTSLDPPVTPGTPHSWAGAAQLHWIDEATDLVSHGVCDALVTGPVSKAVIADSDAPGAKRFRGHTEHLAERLGVTDVVMAFHLGGFSTSLVTTHLALRQVPSMITEARVARASVALARMLGALGNVRPRVVVASLNPHAGEAGLLGDEEQAIIAPGIRRARRTLEKQGLRAKISGPVGAETAFRKASLGEYDGVVAMYHDQATIACKLLGFGEAVNVTLGLPIVRTSVDHGTAYDLAGSGKSSDRGMREAMLLARVLTLPKR